MGLPLWKKRRLIRRYSAPELGGGYAVSAHEDFWITADVQTTDRSVSTGADGDIGLQKLKVFTDAELCIADERTGTPGDRIWFQKRWFECRSSRLSENTFLKHWTSTFVECTNADDEPMSISVEGGRLVILAPTDVVNAASGTLVFSRSAHVSAGDGALICKDEQ